MQAIHQQHKGLQPTPLLLAGSRQRRGAAQRVRARALEPVKLLRRRVCAGLAVGVCAGAAAALRPGTAQAAAASGFPRTLNDALGRRVRLAEAPQRIVAVFPSNVEIAFALGLEARIAAVADQTWDARVESVLTDVAARLAKTSSQAVRS